MPIIKKALYDLTGTTRTKTYVETGTYKGDGVQQVLREYEQIHSMELSEHWYYHTVLRYFMEPHVHLWCGDSALYLPSILQELQEPITIYLDAHYSGPDTANCDYGGTALLQELGLLRQRAFDDIIIIDHVSLFGKKGFYKSPDTSFAYDWTHVTEERIQALLKPNYIMLHNEGQRFTDGAEDQIILIRTPSV